MNIYNWGADRCFISSLRKINLRGARGLVRRLLKQFGYENEDMNFSYSSKSGENRQSQQDLETGYSGKGFSGFWFGCLAIRVCCERKITDKRKG